MAPIYRLWVFAVCLLWATLPAWGQAAPEPASALRGMDVVSDLQAGGPTQGLADMCHDFHGAPHLFANERNKAAFVADPDRYLPQFSGLCATGIGLGKEFRGDTDTRKIVGGKPCFQHRAPVRAKGDADPATVARAHQNWVARG